MKRLLNTTGSMFVLVGVFTLGYAGVTHANSRSPVSPSWSLAERTAGQRIAASVARRQVLALPRSLTHARAAAVAEPALRMIIPKISLNAPVVQTPPVGGVWEVADWSVGHLTTTANAGQAGNGAYSAHDDIKGEIFKREAELKPGDVIKLLTQHSVFTYVVTTQQTVDPSNISVLNPTKAPTITLISCTPYWVDTQRFIIQAVLKSSAAR